jgi:hypothetical protein
MPHDGVLAVHPGDHRDLLPWGHRALLPASRATEETMKLVINSCYGGFSLSARAIARLAELLGRPCFFFTRDYSKSLSAPAIPTTLEKIEAEPSRINRMMFSAYDIPNPDEVLAYPAGKSWHELTLEECRSSNDLTESHQFDIRHGNRADPLLVQVVEELGEGSWGSCAQLTVVEIPDGTDYEIGEYDGIETIHEKHRSWS